MEIPHPTITAIKLCYFTAFPWKFESTQVNQDLTSWAEASGYIMPPPCHMAPQDNSTTWPRQPTNENHPKQATSHDHATPKGQPPYKTARSRPRDHATAKPDDHRRCDSAKSWTHRVDPPYWDNSKMRNTGWLQLDPNAQPVCS